VGTIKGSINIPQRYRVAIDARFVLRPLRGMPQYVYMLCQLLPTVMPEVHFFFFINKQFEPNRKRTSHKPSKTSKL